MTGLAFVCGVLPMVIAHGAGGASQQALGTSVMGGMIAVVILALLMVPVFFVSVQRVLAGDRETVAEEGRGVWAAGAGQAIRQACHAPRTVRGIQYAGGLFRIQRDVSGIAGSFRLQSDDDLLDTDLEFRTSWRRESLGHMNAGSSSGLILWLRRTLQSSTPSLGLKVATYSAPLAANCTVQPADR